MLSAAAAHNRKVEVSSPATSADTARDYTNNFNGAMPFCQLDVLYTVVSSTT